ncbi:Trafficking protein particle complex subunit 2 [Sesbania bispinosa]|nr:Trafficking protein particle complex subunit 2 [Sesbania bispinosa]
MSLNSSRSMHTRTLSLPSLQSLFIQSVDSVGASAATTLYTVIGLGTQPENMIVCVAVVGHQNNPLYIQSFTEADDALKLHHIVHCSLDVVDERVNNPKKSGPMLNETFLGLLYPIENYKVYGYLTNTKVKFILVTTDLDVKDADEGRNGVMVKGLGVEIGRESLFS